MVKHNKETSGRDRRAMRRMAEGKSIPGTVPPHREKKLADMGHTHRKSIWRLWLLRLAMLGPLGLLIADRIGHLFGICLGG